MTCGEDGIDMDTRLEKLKDWLAHQLPRVPDSVLPASSDASFRRYFRVKLGKKSFIAMDAPPDKEDIGPFIDIGRRFYALGLNVPEIYEIDRGNGFLLLGDLGSRVYLDALDEKTADKLYGDAIRALVILQGGMTDDQNPLPVYDHGLLMREMALFDEWYLVRHLGVDLSADQRKVLVQVYEILASSALSQSPVWVHRDYHSRNLMLCDQNNPGILDFQDAVQGPATYDLVSMLRDCYISWPADRVDRWVRVYHAQALESGIPVTENIGRFIEQFDLMGVQRHLKAIGIFARLNHRDGKSGYLKDIPRTYRYVQAAAQKHEVLRPFAALLDEIGLEAVHAR